MNFETREDRELRDKIVKCVSDYYGLSTEKLMAKTRKPTVAVPRQVAIYLLRDQLKLPYTLIAIIFDIDQTTALHAYRKISSLIETSQKLRTEVRELKSIII